LPIGTSTVWWRNGGAGRCGSAAGQPAQRTPGWKAGPGCIFRQRL